MDGEECASEGPKHQNVSCIHDAPGPDWTHTENTKIMTADELKEIRATMCDMATF